MERYKEGDCTVHIISGGLCPTLYPSLYIGIVLLFSYFSDILLKELWCP